MNREAVDAEARILIAAWERAEGQRVNSSYISTFVDMARASLAEGEPSSTASPTVSALGGLLGINIWAAAKGFRVDLRVDFDEYGNIMAVETSDPVTARLLCSQCGERASVMVKVGTHDGWCTVCLNEAAKGESEEGHPRDGNA